MPTDSQQLTAMVNSLENAPAVRKEPISEKPPILHILDDADILPAVLTTIVWQFLEDIDKEKAAFMVLLSSAIYKQPTIISSQPQETITLFVKLYFSPQIISSSPSLDDLLKAQNKLHICQSDKTAIQQPPDYTEQNTYVVVSISTLTRKAQKPLNAAFYKAGSTASTVLAPRLSTTNISKIIVHIDGAWKKITNPLFDKEQPHLDFYQIIEDGVKKEPSLPAARDVGVSLGGALNKRIPFRPIQNSALNSFVAPTVCIR